MRQRLPDDIAQALTDAGDRLGPFTDRVQFLAVTSSTNDLALRRAAAGADDGTTILAAAQTAGRGRRGRQWFSPTGAGLYFSSVLRGLQAQLVTLMAGTAVAEAIRATVDIPVEIKWPNDVVIRPSDSPIGSQPVKIAGVLTETSWVGGESDATVVGIGINVSRSNYPAEFEWKTSSLEAEIGQTVDRAAVFVESLAALNRWRDVLCSGRTSELLARWRALAPSSDGAPVTWCDDGTRRWGFTAGIENDGALRVRCGERIERVLSGELTWLDPQANEVGGATSD